MSSHDGSPAPSDAVDASGDIPAAEFRAAMHRVADMVADYLEHVGDYPVLPRTRPGEVRRQLPPAPPRDPEALDALLDDY